MEKQTYEDRTKRITVAVPRVLHDQITIKLKFSNYTTVSELVRDLLRQWMDRGIIELRPIGRRVE